MKQQFSNKQCAPALLATLLFSAIPFQNVVAQTSSVSVSNTVDPLNPVIVTATRTPTKASDVLADNIYIGPEEIAQAGQTSLVELLQRQRGVEIATSGGAGSPTSVFLRGANSNQALILIDGVRTQSALSGSASLQAIPLGIVDHIEIVFGPQSSLYGSDAIGGVIQIFTKKGAGTAQVNASTGYGSYGTSITDASIYGSLGTDKITSYSLSASQEISTGFSSIASNNPCNPNTQSTATLNSNFCNTPRLSMGRTGYTKSGASGRLTQEWQKGQELGFQFLASRLENQYPVSSFFGGGIGDQINNLGVFSAFSNNQINEFWKSNLQISQSYDLGQQIYSNASPQVNTKLTTYSWQNDLKIGVDLLQLVAERKTANAFSTEGTINQDQNTNTLAGSYKLHRGSHLANLAVRNDSITGFTPQTTGSASYGYFFNKNLRGNINYGTGFKAPSFFDLYFPLYGNTNLLPEKSKNTEIGLHYESKKFDLHAVAFNSTINNLIQYTTTSPPCTSAQLNGPQGGCAGNGGVAKISGASLGGRARLSDLILKASLDQQNPIAQSTGFVLARRARQFGNIGAEYNAKAVKVGAEGTFQGGRYNSGNSNYMGGYAIYNLYASHDITKNLSLFGRWNNVFNKDYQLSYGFNTPGSNVFFGLRYAMQ
jgi:vitamin B12 transporter